MAEFRIAHLREQGQQMIIIPLDSQFEHKSSAAQHDTIEALQACASNAGLAGTVVVAWQAGNRVKFIAPQPWHPFFRSLTWNDILRNLNKVLHCG